MKLTFKTLLLAATLASGAGAYAQESFTLKESIAYGLKHNRSITIYNNNRLQAEQKAREALSTYLPQVNVNAGLDDNLKLPVTVIPAGTFGPGTPAQKVSFGTQYNSTHSVQLDQPIYNQAAITGLKARKPNIELAALNEELNRQGVIYNIATAYYKIIITQKQLDLLEDNKERMEKTLAIAQLRAKEGVSKKIDVKQVQVNLNNTESQISVTRNSYELALNTLKFHLGKAMTEELLLSDTAKWLNPKTVLAGGAPGFDYKKTIDYRLNQTQLSLLDINRKNIRDGRYPTLAFYARYGANGFGNNIGAAYSSLYDFAVVGLKFNWNLFTGFRRDAQYKMADIDYKNAEENLKLSEEQQTLTYQNAGLAYNRAQSTIVTNKANMDLANEVYANVSTQHKEGIATLTDLLNAENSYQQAQNNYIQSLLDFYLAEIELKRANGTLDEYFEQL